MKKRAFRLQTGSGNSVFYYGKTYPAWKASQQSMFAFDKHAFKPLSDVTTVISCPITTASCAVALPLPLPQSWHPLKQNYVQVHGQSAVPLF